MKRYVIDSERDIREFFTDLHFRIRNAFLPEDDLATVVDKNGNAVFSKAEVAYFDELILDCFVFCNDYHLDLHEIVESVQQELRFNALVEPIARDRKFYFGIMHRQAYTGYSMRKCV